MLTESLNYFLPESLIAQQPHPNRDGSRLMVINRADGNITLDVYRNVANYLAPGDCMVLNNTRVIRARLHGNKESGGRVEVFLLHEDAPGVWVALVRPSAKAAPGCRIVFAHGLTAIAGERVGDGKRLVRFEDVHLLERLEASGEIPLPPYIKRDAESPNDAQRYQTIYASQPGAVAAPTAGLHFTEEVFASLDARGVSRQFLTLHVGYGTFKPIVAETLEAHQVDEEWFDFSQETAQTLNQTRRTGGRVIAVGTTCARTLESQFRQEEFVAGTGTTNLYIYPPYEFRALDALQTNFHLPKSSLLALVCAFAGRDLVMTAYEQAVREKFRFYSYGDVMLIL